MQQRIKLTDTFTRRVKVTSGEQRFYDSEVPGLFLRIRETGEKSFCLYYRDPAGNRRCPKLAKAGQLDINQVRELARQWMAEIRAGNDPVRKVRNKADQKTVAEFGDWYMENWASKRKKPNSAANDRILLDRHINPRIGTIRVGDLEYRDVAKLHMQMTETQPVNANRAVALISKMLNLAEVEGLRPHNSNFCKSIQRNREFARERMLDHMELLALAKAVSAFETRDYPWKGGKHRPGRSQVGDLVRLLVCTGARVDELMSRKRDEIVFLETGGGVIEIPDHKGKRAADRGRDKRVKRIGFDEIGEAVIRRLFADCDSEWLFPSPRKLGQHMTEPKAAWEEIRRLAGLDDVTMHDLRAVFGTTAEESMRIEEVAAQLGHADPEITRKHYIRRRNERLKQIAAQTTALLPEEFRR